MFILKNNRWNASYKKHLKRFFDELLTFLLKFILKVFTPKTFSAILKVFLDKLLVFVRHCYLTIIERNHLLKLVVKCGFRSNCGIFGSYTSSIWIAIVWAFCVQCHLPYWLICEHFHILRMYILSRTNQIQLRFHYVLEEILKINDTVLNKLKGNVIDTLKRHHLKQRCHLRWMVHDDIHWLLKWLY